MAPVAPGEPAPDFDLETDGGGRVRLADFAGRKVVVYFYPSDGSETCTAEALAFSKAAAAFADAETAVVGISPDGVKSHDRFKQKHDLDITLASDPDKRAIAAYGLWVEKSMWGRTFMGVERATFLVAPDGRIAREWRKVRLRGHVDQVLAAARDL